MSGCEQQGSWEGNGLMPYQIDKHKAIPPPPRGILTRELKETFAAMEVGDSFRLPCRSRQTLNQVALEIGVEITVRLEGGDHLRVWLMKRL